MQINSNYQSNYPEHQKTTTTSSSKTTSSFDALLNQPQEVPKEENKSKMITYLEENNLFSDLSAEDKALFRNILKDDKVTMAEMNNLSYEQTEKLKDHIYFPNLQKEEFLKTPVILVPSQGLAMMFATQTTNDKTFNEALFRTAKELDSSIDRDRILSEVKDNLSQVHFKEPLRATFYADAFRGNLWKEDIEAMNIDFNSFLSNILNMHENGISNTKLHPQLREQHQQAFNDYSIVLKHFNDIQNENKYV